MYKALVARVKGCGGRGRLIHKNFEIDAESEKPKKGRGEAENEMNEKKFVFVQQ